MAGGSLRLLLIQADRVAAQKLELGLSGAERLRHEIRHVASLDAASGLLAEGPVEAVLFDFKADGGDPEAALRRLKRQTAVPMLLLADDPDDPRARALVQSGAADAVLGNAMDTRGLLHAVRLAIERDGLNRALEAERERADMAQRQVRDMLENSADGQLVLGADATVLYANKAVAGLFGRPAEDLVGEVFEDLPLGEGVVEIRIPRHVGPALAAELRLTESVWDGEPASLATLRDVTTRRRTEEALRTAERQVERASSLKTQFLANMSHELRTPLNSILGFAEVIGGAMFGPVGHRKYAEYATDIHRSATHLLGLITDLLDVSCAEADRFELAEATFSVAAMLRRAVREVRPDLRAAGLRLKLDLEAVEGVAARGDEGRMLKAVLNLLSNGIKFTPPGGEIGLSGHCDGRGDLRITVTDSGVGMDAERVEAAFLAYVRVSDIEVRGAEQGAGIGLALARMLVELHGGWVELESEPGRGTSVVVTLPSERVIGPPPGTIGRLAKVMPFDLGRRGGAA